MIPKVDKGLLDPDLIEDERIYKARPEWMKWYYGAYIMSTISFDDDQHGWYIKLLMWSATEGSPPGFLPDDEDELKEIAGFKELAAPIAYILKQGVEIPAGVLSELEEIRERKWKKVRKKFVKHNTHPGLVYNKKLVQALKTAYNNLNQARSAGSLGAEARWSNHEDGAEKKERKVSTIEKGKLQEERELIAPAIAPGMASGIPAPMANFNLISDLSKKGVLSLEEEETIELREIVVEKGSVLSLEEDPEEEEESLNEDATKEKGSRSGKKKRSGETIFDEKKWQVTPRMSSYLLIKYESDGIKQGDIDYLGEKFALVHHNSRYSSWSRAFFNFVDNQLTKYGYTFGAYKRRGRNRDEQHQRGFELSTVGNEQPRRRPWESGPDRTARLDSEAEEIARRLRGGSLGDRQVSSPGRALAADSDD